VSEDHDACERCGAYPQGWDLHDYCAICSQGLCKSCMADGCCDHVPAKSGMVRDFPEPLDQDDEVQP
jgi:hypothetical protein